MITNTRGATIDVFNLSIDNIDIEDAIVALPNICRYGGRIHKHYSVAQHAVELSQWLRKKGLGYLSPLALLHDACESYIGDIIYPIKTQIPIFEELEHKITELFYEKYGVDKRLHIEFDKYDKNIVVNEMKAVGLYNLDKHLITHLNELSDLTIEIKPINEVRALYCNELIKVFGLKGVSI